jgi:hypothetical protein
MRSAGAAFSGPVLTCAADVPANASDRLEVFWRAGAGSLNTPFERRGAG